jgi:hypothetical protein
MSKKGLKNIPIKTYQDFLKHHGCSCNRTKGGHEHWSKKDLPRPITFASHTDPVPEFVLQNGLRILKLTKKDFEDFLLNF